MMAASSGTAARAARTESDRVSPPTTTASTDGSSCATLSAATASTMRAPAARAAAIDQSSTRCLPSISYCFAPPKRVPRPAATMIAQNGAAVTGRIYGPEGLVGDGCEQHAPDRRLHIRRHAHVGLLADEARGSCHNDHRAVLEEADALSGLLALATDRQLDDL